MASGVIIDFVASAIGEEKRKKDAETAILGRHIVLSQEGINKVKGEALCLF